MSTQKNARTSELGDVLTTGTSGFITRKRTGISLFFHLFLLASIIFFGIALLIYYHSPVGCLVGVAIGIGFGLIAQNLEKQKKIKEALEFMNALFSSALGKGYSFCFIAKTTGEIVFYNRPFQTIFPAYAGQQDRTVKALLALYHVPEADQGALEAILSAGNAGTLATTIRDNSSAEASRISFEIEPIERPTGFVLIRGK